MTADMRVHDALKYWLIALGENTTDARGKQYYEDVYSGDSKPVDVREGMSHLEWRPDVVLVRRGRMTIIEIAFSEKWRELIGEFVLAKCVNAEAFLLITCDEDAARVNNISSLLRKSLDYDPYGEFLNLDIEVANDFEAAKREIMKVLENLDWFN